MPVGPHTCREHAKRCLKLAVKMTNPKLRREYGDTARKWERLADEVAASYRERAISGWPRASGVMAARRAPTPTPPRCSQWMRRGA